MQAIPTNVTRRQTVIARITNNGANTTEAHRFLCKGPGDGVRKPYFYDPDRKTIQKQGTNVQQQRFWRLYNFRILD